MCFRGKSISDEPGPPKPVLSGKWRRSHKSSDSPPDRLTTPVGAVPGKPKAVPDKAKDAPDKAKDAPNKTKADLGTTKEAEVSKPVMDAGKAVRYKSYANHSPVTHNLTAVNAASSAIAASSVCTDSAANNMVSSTGGNIGGGCASSCDAGGDCSGGGC